MRAIDFSLLNNVNISYYSQMALGFFAVGQFAVKNEKK